MKKLTLIALVLTAALNAHADDDVGAFIGVTYAFGTTANKGLGVTLQATTSRREDRAVLAAGVSYYPFADGQKIGIPLGGGYQVRNAAALVGYDVLLNRVAVSGGYLDTREK